ncbi:MAG: 1-(5-phosphoribosyl)-5-[(5-phosphoribosylamino)methylideneamino]imidazole-4-carboxamide isomerase [Desulfarculaceae bacterium]|nr:1-(5-phosphoribosyl)-5-[(5-phosphoribosylamino)methylideneamino]imidazole-4-carboxamide isomerase [Desulfarculaceae bacterium]MCF8073929.1 1-(5-phosphoribosyl)-5-[(5-phosphoribosylamino)methylideneamino]imidazole-4-carboxamide isomerase [Desulfarculaceae bacterium]MCF8102615.1 1-(5-phosphoribosyl)-5-[(5-phosphoribosylamino)methylideneamino]imidazole-4-carboxamide isomerase [Desulfarculaceae bacterium]MCF8117616.1 1-(5-phosphoribosyl)-5-[(5-phosphoribosylamino)methylideneamino]imidazole-4-carb
METIPAVDLKGGRCVRLQQGRMDKETVFSHDPVAMARHWEEQGARRLHVVDLDGAVEGRPANAAVIERICASLSIPVQLGGGVRDLEGLKKALELGVDRVILGTLAAREPYTAMQAAEMFPGRVVIGIDARDGMVAVQGWTEDMGLHFLEAAKPFDRPEVAAIVFTDISRDGMHSGPNLESTAQLCEAVSVPVIAAGGVHDLDDVRRLMELAPRGLAGFITGQAIYEGTLDLAEALALADPA